MIIKYWNFVSMGRNAQHYHCGDCGYFLGNNIPKRKCPCCAGHAVEGAEYMGEAECQYSHPCSTWGDEQKKARE